ncbi:MAG: twin-arginine translocation signal domain-containing protein, partial [Candidatus Brocadia sp.]|nr:twin-arginine translocation signal domain-containing protein [Candidatus Brocadia sp.]
MLDRREFLTITGAGGAALLFGIPNPLHASTTEKEEKTMPYTA